MIVPVAVLAMPTVIPCRRRLANRNPKLNTKKYNSDVNAKQIKPIHSVFFVPRSLITRPVPNRPINVPMMKMLETSPAVLVGASNSVFAYDAMVTISKKNINVRMKLIPDTMRNSFVHSFSLFTFYPLFRKFSSTVPNTRSAASLSSGAIPSSNASWKSLIVRRLSS